MRMPGVDIPILGQLFGSPDPLTLIVSFAFFFAIIYMGLKKKETPIFLALANFIMVFSLYVSLGVASSIYAIILIFANAFLLTRILVEHFLGTMGNESRIMVTYLMFFAICVFFINYANMTSSIFNSNMEVSKISPPTCDLSLDVLILGKIVFCGYSYLNFFVRMLSFGSQIAIVNVVLFIPFVYFIVKYLADWFRGRGAGG
jgi:hypothetical protein